jgi:hypothetical protein
MYTCSIKQLEKRGEDLDNLVDKSNDLAGLLRYVYPSALFTLLLVRVFNVLYHLRVLEGTICLILTSIYLVLYKGCIEGFFWELQTFH